MTIVGLLGRKGSGKDTAAKALIKRGFENIKFAGPLKDMLRTLLQSTNMNAELIEQAVEGKLKESPLDQLNGFTPRHAMQTLGTEWGRMCMLEDFWVNLAILKAVSVPKAIITDVRFPNEVEAIQNIGGIVIGIRSDWAKPVRGEHPSEAKIDDLMDKVEVINNVWGEDPGEELVKLLRLYNYEI